MARSQNGFIANDRSLIRSAVISGTDVKVAIRAGAAGDLLLYVAARWHREVEPLRAKDGVLDCWGYAERKIRGSATTLSNHASGTALDFRARTHPLGKTGTYTAAQVKAIRKLLVDCRSCIRWGGDYSGRKDEMHVEVVRSEADCTHALAELRTAHPEEDMPSLDDVRKVVREELTKSTVAKRDDVGFARNQILTALGVGNPEKAPTSGGVADVRIQALTDAVRELTDVVRELAERE